MAKSKYCNLWVTRHQNEDGNGVEIALPESVNKQMERLILQEETMTLDQLFVYLKPHIDDDNEVDYADFEELERELEQDNVKCVQVCDCLMGADEATIYGEV